MYGKNNFEEHICKIVHKATYIHKFDWIVRQSGLLHFEMNAAKVGVTFWYEYFRFSDHEIFLSKLTFSLKVF